MYLSFKSNHPLIPRLEVVLTIGQSLVIEEADKKEKVHI